MGVVENTKNNEARASADDAAPETASKKIWQRQKLQQMCQRQNLHQMCQGQQLHQMRYQQQQIHQLRWRQKLFNYVAALPNLSRD